MSSQVLGQSVTNDADGNVSSIAATSPFAFSGFSWTGNNKTSTVSLTGGGTINYEYLFNGKRFSSISSVGSDTSKNYYIFAGEMLIGVIGNSPAAPKAAYTWGPDGLISKYDLSSSASSWYEFGPQGETRKLTDASAMGTDAYNYNAYGDLVSSTGSTENAYRFGGKYGYYSDLNSNLILATQRWYSPQMMRWTSRDQINFEGGANLYEYVDDRPVKFFDPLGTTIFGGGSWGTPGSIKPPFDNVEKDEVECGLDYIKDLAKCSCKPPYDKLRCENQAKIDFETCKQGVAVGSIK